MIRPVWSVALILFACGCASPVVYPVGPGNDSKDGVRVRRVAPYEVYVYAVDESGKLVLKHWAVEQLPDHGAAYALNYNGALVTSSKFGVKLHGSGGLKSVHVETTRTLKESAEAAKSITEEVLKVRKAEAEAKNRPQKEQLEKLKAIKEYRTEYEAATRLPAAPGEPLLPDGSKLGNAP